MSPLLFVLTIGISVTVVRLGAIAFEITGLEWQTAKFQALSCFTGTGFTTREAELITVDPQRRRIASFLMVFGNAGLVTLVATFVNSVRVPTIRTMQIPYVDVVLPRILVPVVNLGFIVTVLVSATWVISRFDLRTRLTRRLRNRLLKADTIRSVSFEEMFVATNGYGVSRVHIDEGANIIDLKIRDTGLRQRGITVLAIERNSRTIPNPEPSEHIVKGDYLLCFGKLDRVKDELYPEVATDPKDS